ncbi:hypothetical protein INT45_007946 [Circinella minor]|uniref:Uncharacterized protein n=1 Tax=Circinella minor TaxID=1195481 RepID=A0A8H7RSZ4_9FUNG|nr:hypothetical protein INT45_007946 [Circinella minor]
MASGPIIVRLQGIPHQVEWGFLLENTYFQRFEEHNQKMIEQAYHELCHRVGNHYIDITDAVLANSARVYFGVEQIHLRMPGTRYYVQRRLKSLINTTVARSSPTILSHSYPKQAQHQPQQLQQLEASTGLSSSPQQRPRPSTSSPATLMPSRRANMTQLRSRASSGSITTSINNNGSNTSNTPLGVNNNSNNNNKGGIRNMRRSSPRYTSHNNTTNNIGSIARKVQRQPARRIQKSSSATTTSSFIPVSTSATTVDAAMALSIATTNLTTQQQDNFDWGFSPRLVQKPSQDWSQQSIASPSTPSPQSSPNMMHQEPVIASFQYPLEYTNITMGDMQLQYQQYQQQQQQHQEQQELLDMKSVIAPLNNKKSYKQKTTQSVLPTSISTTIPIDTNSINYSETIYNNTYATTNNNDNNNNNNNTLAKSVDVMNSTNYNNTNNSNLSLTDINNYEVVTALNNLVSMPITPQDSVHDPNQVTFLPQQQQQQDHDLLLLNQLSNTMPMETSEQVFASWSWTPENPITTHIQENSFAAGSANLQTPFNNNYLPGFTTSNNGNHFHQ